MSSVETRGRRNSAKPIPLDPTIVAQSSTVEPGIKSPPITPKRARKEDLNGGASGLSTRSTPPAPSSSSAKNGPTHPKTPSSKSAAAAVASPTESTAPAAVNEESPAPPKPAAATRQIPPNLNLSPSPSTPNPALRSPRPPIHSASFAELERKADDSAQVRMLVAQIEKEMHNEIMRLKTAHARELESKAREFQELAELFQKKREDWAMQISARETVVADMQSDLMALVKKEAEAKNRIRILEEELESQQEEIERLRRSLFVKPQTSAKKRSPSPISLDDDDDETDKPGPSKRQADRTKASKN